MLQVYNFWSAFRARTCSVCTVSVSSENGGCLKHDQIEIIGWHMRSFCFCAFCLGNPEKYPSTVLLVIWPRYSKPSEKVANLATLVKNLKIYFDPFGCVSYSLSFCIWVFFLFLRFFFFLRCLTLYSYCLFQVCIESLWNNVTFVNEKEQSGILGRILTECNLKLKYQCVNRVAASCLNIVSKAFKT